MEYRRLGSSGLWVSPLCLGTMMFGDRTDENESERIVDSARDAGINFIDTADVYKKGASERIVGKLIKPDRERWVLASKVGNAMVKRGEDPNRRGLGRKWILRAVDDSLARLGTDYVDIYYLHRDDLDTPLEETVSALADVVAAGKARYWGLSNYRGWRIGEAIRLAESLGAPRPVVVQPYYNAMNRMPEVEVLPVSAHHGLGVVPYSPLARGVLTGKYTPGAAPPEETRAGRNDARMKETEFRAESLVMAQHIKAHAEKRGMTAGQFAVNWVLNHRTITSVLAGPRTVAQWTEYLGALDRGFATEDEALIDTLVPAGHPSTPGFTDPRYPVIGRLARTGERI
jgi:aryl-alcohol dehydrogenase-like predicted oxidoreductase